MERFQEHYDLLNERQKEAVDFIDGPLLVLAGPGTGKTQLLSVRAANIIKNKRCDAGEILILTFTNAAARAMKQRLARILGHSGYEIEVETFHSFANSIVLESEEAIEYVREKIELSEVEKVRAIEYILNNVRGVESLRPFGAPYIHRREIVNRISELKNEGITPEVFKERLKGVKADGVELEEKHIPRLRSLAVIYEHYEKLKDENSSVLFDERGRIDFDDMIIIALDALKRDENLGDVFRGRYKYIMVDEYQDTNAAQLNLLFEILDHERPNICCVGDDDQAIYRFQGATLSNFSGIKNRFPDIETVTLTDNYRSTSDILDISKDIISQLPEEERMASKKLISCTDYDKRDIRFFEFLTEEEELEKIVCEVKAHAELIRKDKSLAGEERAKPFNNIAVLVRKREQILRVIDAFLKAGIPYATDGEEDIRKEKRVRQMLDVLDLAGMTPASSARNSFALYKVLTSDYMETSQTDILKLISLANKKARSAKESGPGSQVTFDFFLQFQESFNVFRKGRNNEILRPAPEESAGLRITKALSLEDPHALHRAAWAINTLISDAHCRPVHDILMRYVDNTGLYRFILKRYENEKSLGIRDLRALVSFINMIKRADLANPALRLDEFMDELELRNIFGMSVQGRLATLSQDGVRIYTAHKSKGLEFYTVFIPFCLQQKSWPLKKPPRVIRLPQSILKSKENPGDKNREKLLDLYDELRLFYVASTRAKAHLIYTATPTEKSILSPFLGQIGLEPESGAPVDEKGFLCGYLEKTGDGDKFEGTSNILRDIVENLTLNPTSLNNYICCKRKFLYDNVLMLPGKKNQHLVFGNCAHAALEEVYSHYMRHSEFPSFDFFKKRFLRELGFQGVNEAIETWCRDRLETLKMWYEKEAIEPVMPIDLENKLQIVLPGGIIFRGTFDKIEKEGEGSIRVIDYKTGKPDKHIKAMAGCASLREYECDDYFRQLVAYKLLYERSAAPGEERPVVKKGVLQFLEPVAKTVKKYDVVAGDYKNIEVDLDDDMVKELENTIRSCWRQIQELDFRKLSERDGKDRCVRCEYDTICWG